MGRFRDPLETTQTDKESKRNHSYLFYRSTCEIIIDALSHTMLRVETDELGKSDDDAGARFHNRIEECLEEEVLRMSEETGESR